MIHVEERNTARLPGITSLFVSFDYDKAIVDELRLMQNCIYDEKTKEWEIPLTSLSEFLDRCCKLTSISLTLLSDDQSDCCPPQLCHQYITEPFDHQLEGISFGMTHDSWLLLDAPGLGKTLQITYLAQELKQQRGIEHCLIICGINTLKTNWKNEIEKHSNLSCRILGQRYTRKGKLVVDGIAERLKQLQQPIDEFFVITNIETLRDEKILNALLKNKHNTFDMIVLDEIHKAKSHTSQQGKNLLKLNKAKYRIGLTGTLLLNSPLDCYVPLKWIGAESANYSTFRYYYCTYGGPFNNMLVGYKNLEVLKNQIDKYSLRRTKDILHLPPQNIITEYVDMNDAQQIFYDNVKEGIAQEVDKVVLRPANVLAMVGRLRQATACPSILTTENIPSAKIERAVDLAEQITGGGEKVVIFSTFKETVKVLANELQHLGLVVATGDNSDSEIEDAKLAFQNDPDVKVFLGTHQKCGTGITLTAASYMIFLDTPWTAGDFQQACDRIHRIGTKGSVFIYNLVAKDTVDERVLELVTDKEALSDYIVDDKITQKGLASLQKYIEDLL